MDFKQRQQALSELALQALSNRKISTPRLEELIWHRILVQGWDSDLASQCSRVLRELNSSSNEQSWLRNLG